MLRAWKRTRGTRVLVHLISLIAAMDVGITWISLEMFGVAGELNPLILHLYRAGLLPIWSVIAVAGSLVGGAMLVSISLISTGVTQKIAAVAFGSLLSIRLAAFAMSVGGFFGVPLLGLVGLLMGGMTFLIAKRHLTDGLDLNVDMLLWTIKDCAITLLDTLAWLPRTALLSLQPGIDVPTVSNSSVQDRAMRRPDLKKIVTSVAIVAVTLAVLLSLLDFLQGQIFRSVPWWLRELGIVEQLQGQAFLVIFIAILFTLAILTYCILSIAEALGGSRD